MSGRSIHLIDRDELLATLEQDIDVSVTGEENMEAVRRCLQEILDDVKGSPVVEAISVEWLLNHQIVGDVKQNDAVLYLVNLWRKENGSVN